MDAIREQIDKPLVVGIASFVVGAILGLILLGWWLFPVKWTNAGPEQLRPEFQEIYLRQAIDSYTLRQDPVSAQQRIKEVGPDATTILEDIAANPEPQNPDSIQTFLNLAQGAPIEAVTPTPEAAEGGSLARTLLPFMCLITFLLAGGLVAVFLLRNRIGGFKLPFPRAQQEEVEGQVQFPEYVPMEEEPPMAQFMTTYNLGNDLFDDSFSVDSQSGEFLGECGVGISETVGVGEPKKVTAFEVWLFDKNDIQTVTQVLMSKHAFYDEAIRQRLAAKGEPVLGEPGREMVLETAALRLLARIVDMSYGTGALPSESFFDRLTLEMTVWSKS
jgi:hypothetical protein